MCGRALDIDRSYQDERSARMKTSALEAEHSAPRADQISLLRITQRRETNGSAAPVSRGIWRRLGSTPEPWPAPKITAAAAEPAMLCDCQRMFYRVRWQILLSGSKKWTKKWVGLKCLISESGFPGTHTNYFATSDVFGPVFFKIGRFGRTLNPDPEMIRVHVYFRDEHKQIIYDCTLRLCCC